MKIKTKKTMNLPQLIEWGFENTDLTKGRVFSIDDENVRFAPYVSFLADGTGVRVPCTITQDNTFKVEVEEEITEDTVFKESISLDVDDDYFSYEDVCVSDFDEDRVRAIYIPNNDLTMTLIWRDGKLVE